MGKAELCGSGDRARVFELVVDLVGGRFLRIIRVC
jgi:hypothetical protein